MPKTRFDGQIEIWDEGDQIRVGILGGGLPSQVRLSTHRDTTPGKMLSRLQFVEKLQHLRTHADVISIDLNQVQLLAEDEYLLTIELRNDIVYLEFDHAIGTNQTRSGSPVFLDIKRVLGALGWKNTRINALDSTKHFRFILSLVLNGAHMRKDGVLRLSCGVHLDTDASGQHYLYGIQDDLLYAWQLEKAMIEVGDVPVGSRPGLIVDTRQVRPSVAEVRALLSKDDVALLQVGDGDLLTFADPSEPDLEVDKHYDAGAEVRKIEVLSRENHQSNRQLASHQKAEWVVGVLNHLPLPIGVSYELVTKTAEGASEMVLVRTLMPGDVIDFGGYEGAQVVTDVVINFSPDHGIRAGVNTQGDFLYSCRLDDEVKCLRAQPVTKAFAS